MVLFVPLSDLCFCVCLSPDEACMLCPFCGGGMIIQAEEPTPVDAGGGSNFATPIGSYSLPAPCPPLSPQKHSTPSKYVQVLRVLPLDSKSVHIQGQRLPKMKSHFSLTWLQTEHRRRDEHYILLFQVDSRLVHREFHLQHDHQQHQSSVGENRQCCPRPKLERGVFRRARLQPYGQSLVTWFAPV